MTGKRGKRSKLLLNEIKETRGHWITKNFCVLHIQSNTTTVCVIHKNSLLLNQHNGHDALQKRTERGSATSHSVENLL